MLLLPLRWEDGGYSRPFVPKVSWTEYIQTVSGQCAPFTRCLLAPNHKGSSVGQSSRWKLHLVPKPKMNQFRKSVPPCSQIKMKKQTNKQQQGGKGLSTYLAGAPENTQGKGAYWPNNTVMGVSWLHRQENGEASRTGRSKWKCWEFLPLQAAMTKTGSINK